MKCIEDSVKDIEAAESWEELERIFLKEKKYPLGPQYAFAKGFRRHDFVNFIGAVYGLERTKEICVVNYPLPATVVKADGRIYYIHGIVHDSSHTAIVQQALKEEMNAVTEPILNRIYSLEKAIMQSRLDEIKYCGLADSHIDDCLTVAKAFASPFLQKQKQALKEAAFYDAMVYHLLRLDALNISIDMRQASYPPHLEAKIPSYKMAGSREERLLFLRSLSQAEFIRNTAARLGWMETHGLYGLMHENDIAMLLRNRAMSEELEERLKTRAKINKAAHSIMPLAVFGCAFAVSYPFAGTDYNALALPAMLPLMPSLFVSFKNLEQSYSALS